MKYQRIRKLRFFTALSLAHVVLISSSMFVLASPARNFSAGEITVFGNGDRPFVTVNGEQVASGRTFLSSGLVETSATSSADINLGRVGAVSLSPDSVLSLSFTETSISGSLSAGKMRVSNAAGVSVSIDTPDGAIINDSDSQASFTIDLRSGKAEAAIEAGSIRFADGRAVGQTQTTTRRHSGVWIPVAVLAGAVAIAVITTIASGDDDSPVPVVSPVR